MSLDGMDGWFSTLFPSTGLVYYLTFSYIFHKNQPDVGKYTSPIDGNWGKFSFPVRI